MYLCSKLGDLGLGISMAFLFCYGMLKGLGPPRLSFPVSPLPPPLNLFPLSSWAAVPGHWAGASPRFCPLKLIDFCADFYSTNVIVR